MKDWQIRVKNEADELEIKYLALNSFISNLSIEKTIEGPDLGLLVRQSRAMQEYLNVLKERMMRFQD